MDRLELAQWRERVAALYLSDVDIDGFRRARDTLFRSHPQSPIPPADRASFTGLDSVSYTHLTLPTIYSV